MKWIGTIRFGFAFALVAAAVTQARDASACGGCFVQQSENTEVSGHRMIFSLAPDHTTLWDQIVYSGNPSSFAWVLPIKGTVDIGLSSDALFGTLEQETAVTVLSPQLNCPPPPCSSFGTGGATATGVGGGGGGGVTVIAQQVVGPYETVQLASTDPNALTTWLTDHGYNIPADIAPVISAYVSESFNFLALKLVPGQGVDSMKPVRVTTPGATPLLPLRMVAAGTGTVTPITLWVFGEGRYEPSNFPTFTIDPKQVVWDWDTQSSNYSQLRQAGFTETQGFGWLVESAQPMSTYTFDALVSEAQYDPTGSGYADAMGQGAVEAAQADVDALIGSISALFVTRVHGELSRKALGQDLYVGASMDQSSIWPTIQATQTTGTPPACPSYPPCDTSGAGAGNVGGGYPASGDYEASGSCAIDGRSAPALAIGLASVGLLAGIRRRRRRRKGRDSSR